MPRLPPPLVRGFARATPILRPLAIGGGATAGLLAGGQVIKQAGRAKNPRLQRENIDTNADGRADTVLLFDTKTGGATGYGSQPTFKGDDQRSDDERTKWLIGGAAVVGLAVVFMAVR